MAKSIFLFDNQADLGTVTASSTAGATMAAANVQNSQRSVFWRSAAGASSYLNLTLPNVYGASHIALVDVNLSTAGTIRVQSWADSLGGAVPGVDMTFTPSLYFNNALVPALYGSGLYGVGLYGSTLPIVQDSGRNITLVPFGTVSTDSFWRVTLADSNVAYQQCGRLFLGSGLQFAYNLSYGWKANRQERSVARESIGGQRFVQPRDSRLQLGGTFELLTDAERTTMLQRLQEYGESKPFVYSIYPEQTNQGLTTTLYGRFASADLTGSNFNINSLQFNVIEEL